MNLKSEILKEHSKRQAIKIGKWVGNNRSRFKQLMKLFLKGEYRVTQRSAWIISYCADNHPKLILPWIAAMVKKMQEPGVHDAVPRNVVRILRYVDIPRPVLGMVMGICFEYIASADYPIAIRANAMTVLANIAKQEPGIINELKATIKQRHLQESAGLRSRAQRILKLLSKRK